MNLNLPSPIEKIYLNNTVGEIHIKRDDLIHPMISGNKWRKLKGLLQNFEGKEIITYGGAFSNHLLAVASYCHLNGFHSKGIIRGKELDDSNPTLKACSQYGMKLEFIDRLSYKAQTENPNNSIASTQEQLVIPEGGTTALSKIGMKDLVNELKISIPSKPLNIFCSYGTGGTALGIGHNLASGDHLTIVPAIKGLTIDNVINNQINLLTSFNNFSIEVYPTMKRYAAKDLSLFEFCEDFYLKHKLLLDPIYTGKVMFYLYNHHIPKKDREIVFIHTGGIQAWKGYFYRFPELKSKLQNIYKAIYPSL